VQSSSPLITSEHEVKSKLAQFGASLEEWHDIVRHIVSGRRDVLPIDALTAGGQFAYLFAVRAIRSVLLGRGYMMCRENNIEGVYHPDQNIKIFYQAVELAAGDNDPKAVYDKNAGFENLVESSQMNLFPEYAAEEKAKIEALRSRHNATVFLLCVSVNGDERQSVRAEISCPKSLANGQFAGFHERIALIVDDDWGNFPTKRQPDTKDFFDDFIADPIVVRI
jgi:hypothetical protein